MAQPKSLRYIVTGPGLGVDQPEPSYADFGPALSRSVTAASASEVEGTWYVRDSISGVTLGYSEVTLKAGTKVTETVQYKMK